MLIKGDVAEEIAELKRQPGKDITILGSSALVRSLLLRSSVVSRGRGR